MTKPGDTKDPDKYIYSGYDLGFDSTGDFTHPQGRKAKHIIIFGVYLSNSAYATNEPQNILILGHGLTQKITQQFRQKKCIHLILVQKIKDFV